MSAARGWPRGGRTWSRRPAAAAARASGTAPPCTRTARSAPSSPPPCPPGTAPCPALNPLRMWIHYWLIRDLRFLDVFLRRYKQLIKLTPSIVLPLLRGIISNHYHYISHTYNNSIGLFAFFFLKTFFINFLLIYFIFYFVSYFFAGIWFIRAP